MMTIRWSKIKGQNSFMNTAGISFSTLPTPGVLSYMSPINLETSWMITNRKFSPVGLSSLPSLKSFSPLVNDDLITYLNNKSTVGFYFEVIIFIVSYMCFCRDQSNCGTILEMCANPRGLRRRGGPRHHANTRGSLHPECNRL